MSWQKRKQKSRSRNLFVASAIVLATGLFGSVAQAQFVYWDGGAGADHNWSTGANWDTDAEPTIDSEARLNNGGTIDFSEANEIALTFRIGEAADTSLSTANLGLGGTVNFAGTGALATGPFIPSIDVGVAPGSTSIWNHNGGTVTTLELFRVGVDAGATGTLNMHAGTIDVSTTDTQGLDFFLIGDNGNGTMNMDGGLIKSRGLIGVALQPASTSVMNISGGDLQGSGNMIVGGNSNIPAGFGGVATLNLAGGSVKMANEISFSDSVWATSTVTHSAGTLEGNGVLVGKFSDATYTLSGTGAILANGQFNLSTFTPLERPEGAANAPKTTFTQSGTSTVVAAGMVVGEFGHAIYTMNGGSLHVTGTPTKGGTLPNDTFRNLLIGRDGGGINQGFGEFTQNAGTVTIDTDIFLGDFDDSNGNYTVSGGSLAVGGNVHIGAALASNAPSDETRLEPSEANGAQGQALRAGGTFTVRGGAATINIAGKLLANPGDKGAFRSGPGNDNHATLAFQVGDSGALSIITVGQQADLDGAVIDLGFLSTSTFLPAYQQQFVLVNAASFGATGTGTTESVGTGSNVTLAVGDALDWAVSMISASGGRQSLIATNLVVPGDATNDKKVDFQDLVILAQNYNILTGKTRATGDFNRTTGVDFADLVILAQNYNFGTISADELSALGGSDFASDWAIAQALVPEPATLSAIAGVGLLQGRRRRAVNCG
jgi:hypothetical protein